MSPVSVLSLDTARRTSSIIAPLRAASEPRPQTETPEEPAAYGVNEITADLEGFHGDDPIALMRAIFPNLIEVQMIPAVGHMIALEASDKLNVILLDYLARITAE